MTEKICVYTCITGDYDDLHEIKNPEKGIDYLCFTNNKQLKSSTWKIIQIKDKNLNNHFLSRKIKMLGHPLISDNYDISVWIDASVTPEKSIKDFVNTYLKNAPFAAFRHHARKSIREEALACLSYHKDSKENIKTTLAFLEKEHFPDTLGLYEMTVFIKRHNDHTVIETMKIWFETIQKYSKRDQLSFMYAIWKTNLQISAIDLNVWGNQWFSVYPHNAQTSIEKCYVYYDNSENINIDNYYSYEYKKNKNTYSIDIAVPIDTNRIKINATDVPAVCFNDINITPQPDKIILPPSIPYGSSNIFRTEYDNIEIIGPFKKDQHLNFSISLSKLNASELYSLIQQLWSIHIEQSDIINGLTGQLKTKEAEINSIQNSKTWKIISRIKRIIR